MSAFTEAEKVRRKERKARRLARQEKLKQKKPRLSGFQRRKLKRMKALNGTLVEPVQKPEDLRRIRVGHLESVRDWRREIAKIYREMRFCTLRTEVGTRLVYVAEIGARLAKMQEELQSIEELRQQLEQLQQQGFLNREAVEYLPASQGDNADE